MDGNSSHLGIRDTWTGWSVVEVCPLITLRSLSAHLSNSMEGRTTLTITGNTILITGGATGIGLALARGLAERGNKLIICGRSGDALAKAQADLPALVTRVCDVADAGSRRSMVEWLKAEHRDLNAVINNAGVQNHRDFTSDPGMQTLDQEVATNLTAPIHLIAELLPMLKEKSHALIVNVSSGLAFSPMADVPVYCATKAGIHSFTLSLRHQLKATGIRVVEVAPPIVDTGLGGDKRSEGTANNMMVTPEAFATEALAQLEAGNDEVLVGVSVQTRKLGEAMFERMNSRS
ncbi:MULTISPECIES: SDR family oxidoreductase [unclassified Rhizobium]|uniref:SDR family oxidoreductase n=1 Tax=unclassified Rhizobium TaxID=2613769 RepID=UPI002180A766|nr:MULTISPECIES: SDR family oxidoreductase [unclassified Rhizobium]